MNNTELFLLVQNSLLIFAVGYILGKTYNTPKTRVHPDFQDQYGNIIIDDREYEKDYSGVILYEDFGDDGEEAWTDT